MLLNCGIGEGSWESLGLQGDQPVHSQGNHSWICIGRTDAEAETPVLRPPDSNNWLIGKDHDAGKDLRWEENGTTENEMDGCKWVWVSPGSWWWTGKSGVLQSMGSQRSDMTEWLNWTEDYNWCFKEWAFELSLFTVIFLLLIISQAKKPLIGESVGEVVCKSLTSLGKLPLDHPVCFFVLFFVCFKYISLLPSSAMFQVSWGWRDMLIPEIF